MLLIEVDSSVKWRRTINMLSHKNFRSSVLSLPLQWRLGRLRRALQDAFSEDTAAAGFPRTTPSAGHCAAVSAVTHFYLGGGFASAYVDGQSHWFNRFRIGPISIDADLTGDQFGRPEIQAEEAGRLYPGTRPRSPEELNDETLVRAATLARRARLEHVYRRIQSELDARRAPMSVQSAG